MPTLREKMLSKATEFYHLDDEEIEYFDYTGYYDSIIKEYEASTLKDKLAAVAIAASQATFQLQTALITVSNRNKELAEVLESVRRLVDNEELEKAIVSVLIQNQKQGE